METNATRMCALLVGLPDVNVIGVEDDKGQPLRVHIETIATITGCSGCGTRAWSKGLRSPLGRWRVRRAHRWRAPRSSPGDDARHLRSAHHDIDI